MFDNKAPNPYSASHKVGIEPTFFGKVMTFFGLAVLMSVAGVYITNAYFMNVFFNAPWIMYALFAVELGLVFTSRRWSKKNPINKVLFALFAFITGVTIAPLIGIVVQSPEGVAILTKALLATGFMFGATAIIGWTTQKDLSGMRGFLIMALVGMIVVGVIGIFVPWGNTFEIIFSGIGVVLFSAFTMHDFQKLKHYPEDRYIEAALNLYLDIFNLFLYILRLIMALNRR